MFEDSPFDLVFLDMMMPERDGLSTLRVLLDKWPQARVVAMSGKADFLPKARDLGAVETLWKPIDSETLLDTVEKFLKED